MNYFSHGDRNKLDRDSPSYDPKYAWDYFFTPHVKQLEFSRWRSGHVRKSSIPDFRCDHCYIYQKDCRKTTFMESRCDECRGLGISCTLVSVYPGGRRPVSPRGNALDPALQQPVPSAQPTPGSEYPFGPFAGTGAVNSTGATTLSVPSYDTPSPPGPAPPEAPMPAQPLVNLFASNRGTQGGLSGPDQTATGQVDTHGSSVPNTPSSAALRPGLQPSVPSPTASRPAASRGSNIPRRGGSARPPASKASDPPGRGGARRRARLIKCQACAARCAKRIRPCDADPEEGIGCTTCTNWGLFCVVGDQVLVPRPPQASDDWTKFSGTFVRCIPCLANNRRCDRKRPCDSCVRFNDTCITEGPLHGCFWRGVDGDDQPL
ncbi:hypothetical protein F5Y06DRAFT_217175 [Hypoxylon sp. FL0890]|nr:hypothetical protein F5Y06DRAFT_217175 [Hypoxylon sp. FL0890]